MVDLLDNFITQYPTIIILYFPLNLGIQMMSNLYIGVALHKFQNHKNACQSQGCATKPCKL